MNQKIIDLMSEIDRVELEFLRADKVYQTSPVLSHGRRDPELALKAMESLQKLLNLRMKLISMQAKHDLKEIRKNRFYVQQPIDVQARSFEVQGSYLSNLVAHAMKDIQAEQKEFNDYPMARLYKKGR